MEHGKFHLVLNSLMLSSYSQSHKPVVSHHTLWGPCSISVQVTLEGVLCLQASFLRMLLARNFPLTTWLYNILPRFYLTQQNSTSMLLYLTLLRSTMALLDSRWFYCILQWLDLTVLDSTTAYHSSTWIYLALLHSTIALLDSRWFYCMSIGYKWRATHLLKSKTANFSTIIIHKAACSTILCFVLLFFHPLSASSNLGNQSYRY